MKNRLTLIMTMVILYGCQKKEITAVSPAVTKFFTDSSLPAAVMGAATESGKATWYAFGPSRWNGSDTVTEDHIFRIMSMTKAITSVAALQLVERGVLGLNDPLNDLMPEMVSIPILRDDGELIKSDRTITLKHLLTHTSGFAYDFMSSRLRKYKRTDWEYEDAPRLFEPGEQWHYGTSLDWVGRIIENVSGQDLETYFRNNITGPLKMNRTWFNVPDSLKNDIVSWGRRDSTGFHEHRRIPETPVKSYNAGGGLFGSPKDYLTFLQCLLNDGKYPGGQLLRPETVELMFENQLEDMTVDYEVPDTLSSDDLGFIDESDKHGLAWAIEDNSGEAIRPKRTGYWGGAANSYFTIDKENGVAVVYFSQIVPFNDKEAFGLFRLFEKEVYSEIRGK